MQWFFIEFYRCFGSLQKLIYKRELFEAPCHLTINQMKRAGILLIMAFFGATLYMNAQTQPNDFFVGKWELIIQGAPGGEDIAGLMILERKNGTLEGSIVDQQLNQEFKIVKVAEKGNQITLYFNTDEYGEVTYNLEKVDDNNLMGTAMDFLYIKGKRVLE